jgi:NAD(P)H-dependent flavin oxidoreductase YrpB (nitropropane dioxygenase family)
VADLETLRALGLPFWLAGGFGTPDKLAEALAAGARGVQVGTAFALCEDSGMREDLRAQVRAGLREGSLDVRTDGRASPTGFPFKVAQLEGTMASPDVVAAREKVCDLGYLRTAFDRGDGSTGYRCPGEPDLVYIRKGGAPEDLEGRLCLCNGLAATAGIGQVRADGSQEQPVVTLGSDLPSMHAALDHFPSAWTAVEVVDWLMSGVPEAR